MFETRNCGTCRKIFRALSPDSYHCKPCIEKWEPRFQQIKDWLGEVGPKSKIQIALHFNMAPSIIDLYLSEDRMYETSPIVK